MAGNNDQNWVVWNQGKNPLVNFNFMLRVELMFDLPCRSVRAFQRELEYDYVQEGGLNDYVHMLRKPISRPFTLEVERYVGVDYVDPLPLGADLVLPIMLFVSRTHDQFIPGVVARTYVFTGCTVMKKTYGDLVADQSGLLVETTTIGYREMLCVDIPWTEVGDNIGASTPAAPTRAITADKSAAELKIQGQELYEKARQAREKADSEYTADEAAKLIETLEQTLEQIEKGLLSGGAIRKALDTAEKGMKDAGGKELSELAKEAQVKVEEEKENVRLARTDWAEKDKTHTDLVRQLAELEELHTLFEDAAGRKTALEEKLPEAVRTPEAAQAAVDKARARVEQADEDLANARLAYEQAAQESGGRTGEAAETAVNDEEENNLRTAEELEKAEEAYKQAQETLDAANAGLAAADQQLTDSRELADVEKELGELDTRLADAGTDRSGLKTKYDALTGEVAAARNAADAARTRLDTDTANLEKAEKTAVDALERASKAKQALDRATDAKTRAERVITPMRNNLTNLKSRKDKTDQAQKSCGESFEACREANTKLQGLSNEPLSDVASAYELVRKHYKDTTFHERQTRDMKGYIDQGTELYEKVEDLTPQAAAVGGDETGNI